MHMTLLMMAVVFATAILTSVMLMIVMLMMMSMAVRIAAHCGEKTAALGPRELQPEDRDHRVTCDFDPAHGVVHRASRHAYKARCDANEDDRNDRLQHRRDEGQDDTAPPGFVVRDHVRRNHRLAVAGAGGVKDAVEKRHTKQRPCRGAICLCGADQSGKLAIELGLLGEYPADDAIRWRCRRRTRRAEGPVPCANKKSGNEAIASVTPTAITAPVSKRRRVTDTSPRSCWRRAGPYRRFR